MIPADRQSQQYLTGGKQSDLPSTPSIQISDGPKYSFNKVVIPDLLAKADCLDFIEKQMSAKLEAFKKHAKDDDKKEKSPDL